MSVRRLGVICTWICVLILPLAGACGKERSSSSLPSLSRVYVPPSGWRIGRAYRSPIDSSIVALAAVPHDALVALQGGAAETLTPTRMRPVAAGWGHDGNSVVLADSPLGRPARLGDDLVVLTRGGDVVRSVRTVPPVDLAAQDGQGVIVAKSEHVVLLLASAPSEFYSWTRLAQVDLRTGQVRWITERDDSWSVTAFAVVGPGRFIVAEEFTRIRSEPPSASRIRIINRQGDTLGQADGMPGLIDTIVPLAAGTLVLGGPRLAGAVSLGLWFVDDDLTSDPRALPFSDLRWPTPGLKRDELLATQIQGPGETNALVSLSLRDLSP
jgi:hypothetical protein